MSLHRRLGKELSRRLRVGILLIALVPASCGDATDDAGSTGPHIVVSTSLLGDVVTDIVGAAGSVDVLMPIGADPHDFAPSVRQAASLGDADLIVISGLGFEPGLEDAVTGAEDAGVPVLRLGAEIDSMPFADSGDTDPHWFTDPVLMADAARIAGVALMDETEIGPVVTDRAEEVARELSALDEEIRTLLEPIPDDRRILVTNHDVFGYFADRYDITVLDTLVPGGTTLAETGSASLADLVAEIDDAEVTAVFVDTSSPTDLAEALAGEVGRPVAIVPLYTESLGPPDSNGSTYADMLRTDAIRIAEALT